MFRKILLAASAAAMVALPAAAQARHHSYGGYGYRSYGYSNYGYAYPRSRTVVSVSVSPYGYGGYGGYGYPAYGYGYGYPSYGYNNYGYGYPAAGYGAYGYGSPYYGYNGYQCGAKNRKRVNEVRPVSPANSFAARTRPSSCKAACALKVSLSNCMPDPEPRRGYFLPCFFSSFLSPDFCLPSSGFWRPAGAPALRFDRISSVMSF